MITGAASGFGLAIAQTFLSEGCKVVAADLNEGRLSRHFSPSATMATVEANVTVTGDWSKMVSLAKDRFGRLDILVNNAGTSYRNKVGGQPFDTVQPFERCLTAFFCRF